MALHNDLGKKGEQIAVDFLTQKHYTILERDWRSGHRDLDIIAWYENTLVIVEVKTRRDDRFGNPEEALTNRKIRSIIESTDAYLRCKDLHCQVRFDFISIIGNKEPFRITHFEDAFQPPLW